MKLFITVLVLCVATAFAQDFPPSIGLCGEGACKVTPVIKDENGVATGVGPVDATLPLGEAGSYPTIIALCGRGTCVTVPVVTAGMTAAEAAVAEGMSPMGDWPDSIGLCGRGICKVTPIIKDMNGVATGIGPVSSTTLGTSGDYPASAGVCGRGTCIDLPVLSTGGGRKLLAV